MALSVFNVNTFAAGYTDTKGHWAEEFINKWSLGDKSILAGYGGAVFAPDDAMKSGDLDLIIANVFGKATPEWVSSPAISREQAMKKIAIAFGITPIDEVSTSERFEDHNQISEDCMGYVYALKELGIVHGMGNNKFAPKAEYTRAEALSVVYQTVSAIADKDSDLKQETYMNTVVVRTSNVTIKDKTFDGDLIIGHGVGDGDVILDNTEVNGRLLVFGGGTNSIILRDSNINNIEIFKATGQIPNVKIEGQSSVEMVTVDESCMLIITGSVERVVVEANATLQIEGNSTIPEILITGESAKVEIAGSAKVTEVTMEDSAIGASLTVEGTAVVTGIIAEAENTAISVTGSAEVQNITLDAQGAKVTGNGKVNAVTVTENVEGNTVVATTGTTVKNSSGAAVVDNAGKTVAAADTESTTPSKTSSSDNSNSGNNNSNGNNTGENPATTKSIASVSISVESPVTGHAPQTAIAAATEYSATIAWSNAPVTFAANTVYTATVTLTSKSGYQFTSATTIAVSQGVTAAKTNQTASELKFTVTYPATGNSAPTAEQEAAFAEYLALLMNVNQADYTAASWATYQIAVEENAVSAANSAEEIEAAITAILAAQEKLETISEEPTEGFAWEDDATLYVVADFVGSVWPFIGSTKIGTLTTDDGITVKDGLLVADTDYIVVNPTGAIVEVTGDSAANTIAVNVSGSEVVQSGEITVTLKESAFGGAAAAGFNEPLVITMRVAEGNEAVLEMPVLSLNPFSDDGGLKASLDKPYAEIYTRGEQAEIGVTLTGTATSSGAFTMILYDISKISPVGHDESFMSDQLIDRQDMRVEASKDYSNTKINLLYTPYSSFMQPFLNIQYMFIEDGYVVETPKVVKDASTTNAGLEVTALEMFPQEEGKFVHIDLILSGEATLSGLHTLTLSSDEDIDIGEYDSSSSWSTSVESGDILEEDTRISLYFVMPAHNVDDLTITHTFEEDVSYE